MTPDDSGDQAKGNPGFFINATNLKTDGIQLAGDLLGVIELGFGVCAGLKASEDESVIDTGDNAKVIGAGYQLTKCREVGVAALTESRTLNWPVASSCTIAITRATTRSPVE